MTSIRSETRTRLSLWFSCTRLSMRCCPQCVYMMEKVPVSKCVVPNTPCTPFGVAPQDKPPLENSWNGEQVRAQTVVHKEPHVLIDINMVTLWDFIRVPMDPWIKNVMKYMFVCYIAFCLCVLMFRRKACMMTHTSSCCMSTTDERGRKH